VAEKLGSQLEPIDNELRGLNARHDALEQKLKDKKPEEITEEEKTEREACHKDMEAQETKKRELLAGYAKDTPVVSQLIDLALLQNGLLKGEALAKFLKRSVELL
ncbi:MAG: molecular chaperone HtpG, partial [Alloprevotella sp.]|nr:molecular chaperone HtpG [Alloprevotella sp.]